MDAIRCQPQAKDQVDIRLRAEIGAATGFAFAVFLRSFTTSMTRSSVFTYPSSFAGLGTRIGFEREAE